MLDYFLLQGYVEMNEEGSISKTEVCPKDLKFFEDANGKIHFFAESSKILEDCSSIFKRFGIYSIEQAEELFGQTHKITYNG